MGEALESCLLFRGECADCSQPGAYRITSELFGTSCGDGTPEGQTCFDHLYLCRGACAEERSVGAEAQSPLPPPAPQRIAHDPPLSPSPPPPPPLLPLTLTDDVALDVMPSGDKCDTQRCNDCLVGEEQVSVAFDCRKAGAFRFPMCGDVCAGVLYVCRSERC